MIKKSREKEKQRQLTEAEQKRKQQFEELEQRLTEEGWEKRDLTVGLVFANIMAVLLCIPFAAIFIYAFLRYNQTITVDWTLWELLLYYILLLVMIPVHELIHGITWAIFAKHHWKAVKFGFIKKYLTPYCTCSDPLERYAYIIGGGMPTFLLGIIPAGIAVWQGSMLLLILGIFMILAGGGDMLILLRILLYRPKKKEVIYIDHPYQAGVVAFER